jgi:hypothetical protein
MLAGVTLTSSRREKERVCMNSNCSGVEALEAVTLNINSV